MAALTQADVDRLKAKLDAGDRAGFYLLYHDLTGSNEALAQAEVSNFSGELGRQAMHMNAAVQAYLWAAGRADQYPGTIENFSQIIANGLYDRIAKDVENGGTGIFRDRDVFDFAKETWKNNKIGDCFPGNLVDPEVPSAPMCSRVAAALGGVRATAEWLDAIGPMPPGIPPGGQQLTTPDGQATYIIDNRGMVVPGSVQRTPAAPRPFDFNGTQPDGHGQINAPGWAGQAGASAAPNNGSSGSYPWSGITAGAMPPWIPALAPLPPSAPIGPFDWLQPDLLGKVGGLAPGGGFGPPPSTIGLGAGAPVFSPQRLDFAGPPAWPSMRSPDGSGTLNIYNGTLPPLPYPPIGPFGGGLMPSGALGPPQPNPPENGAPSAPPQTRIAPQPFPVAPTSPFGVPVPPALQPLVPHFFPQGFDTNNTQAWPSIGTSDGAGMQPNPAGSAGAGLGLTPAQLTPQQFAAPPPFDVPIPEALRPLLRLFFP